MKLMARMKLWWSELKIQVRILWKKGRAELALYREERYADLETLWVPTKRGWQRGRILRHGQSASSSSSSMVRASARGRLSASDGEIPGRSERMCRPSIPGTPGIGIAVVGA
jgi:hypothetical protein